MRIAVYGCNFGNYRNELRRGIDNIVFHDEIDYYFFTDNPSINSSRWKIVCIPLLPTDATMNAFRWTAKYVKFILPEILKSYDVVVWCDSKLFLRNPLDMSKEKIEQLFQDTGVSLCNIKHPSTITPHQELMATMRGGVENVLAGNKFINEIKGIKYATTMVDSCFIVRKTDDKTNKLFECMFDLMKTKGLKRDQNVYNHAIHITGYPVNKIKYLSFSFIHAKPKPKPVGQMTALKMIRLRMKR